jgi:hypothetical protein
MRKSKTSISKATTYRQIAEYWDTHSLADYWDQTKPVEFQVEIESEITFYPVANKLSSQILRVAKRQGITPETLLNLWVQEKLQKA